MSQQNPGAGAPLPGGGGNGGDDRPDPRWFWLTAFQYVLIAVVTLLFVWGLVKGLNDVKDLADMDTARGLITFVIAVGTITIAVMLALTAVVTRDFDKRISVGKEILTILVGVLGTIVGFYYGAAASRTASPQGSSSAITVAAPKLAQSADGNVSLTTKLTGGTAPYTYTIKFVPDTVTASPSQESADGQISYQFKQPTPPLTEVAITIEGKDKDGNAFALNKDGKIKTKIP